MKKVTPEEKEELQAMLDQHSKETAVSEQMASEIRRFVNYIIDSSLYGIAVSCLVDSSLFEGAVSRLVRPTEWVLIRIPAGAYWLYGLFILFVLSLPFLFLYYFVFEAVFQRTPAKLITNTKVVMLDGSKPSGGTIAKRTLIRIHVPFAPFFFWHGRWSKTEVVKVSWSWLNEQTRWKRFLIGFLLVVVKLMLLLSLPLVIIQVRKVWEVLQIHL